MTLDLTQLIAEGEKALREKRRSKASRKKKGKASASAKRKPPEPPRRLPHHADPSITYPADQYWESLVIIYRRYSCECGHTEVTRVPRVWLRVRAKRDKSVLRLERVKTRAHFLALAKELPVKTEVEGKKVFACSHCIKELTNGTTSQEPSAPDLLHQPEPSSSASPPQARAVQAQAPSNLQARSGFPLLLPAPG